MSVSDDGEGVPSAEVEQVFFAEPPRAHPLTLLRRRLQGLFGQGFGLEVRSDTGQGTTVTMRIPLQTQFEVCGEVAGKHYGDSQLGCVRLSFVYVDPDPPLLFLSACLINN